MASNNGNGSVLEHSVTKGDVAQASAGIVQFIIPAFGGAYIVSQLPPELPQFTYGSKDRDVLLSLTPYVEGQWANALMIAMGKVAGRGIQFDGPVPLRVKRMQDVFRICDGRRGFARFLLRHLRDFFTTNNGAVVEIERAGRSPASPIVSFHHLDSLRCYRTGDPDTPFVYQDLHGEYHELQWWECFSVVDMESPRAGFLDSGWCGAARAYRHIRKLAALDVYMDEKITGGGFTEIEFVQGVTFQQLQNAKATAQSERKAEGFVQFNGKLVIPILSDQQITTATVNLKGVPDGFTRKEEFQIAELIYTKALGLPPHDLDPELTARQSLGGGLQMQIIDDAQSGYGLGTWEKQFTNAVNELLTPEATVFKITRSDLRDEKMRAENAEIRARTRQSQIFDGEINADQARQMAVDAGDVPPEFIEQDETAFSSLSDEEKPREGAAASSSANGNDITTAEKATALTRLLDALKSDIAGVNADLKAQRITAEEWKTRTADLLHRFHEDAYKAGAKIRTRELTDLERELVELRVAEQMEYLDDFAAEIENADEWQPQWDARTDMYANAVTASYWEGRTQDLPLPAMPGDGTTQCLTNCKCRWKIVEIDADAGDYDCTWVRAAKDSCQTCVERAELWAPLQIRGWNIVL